MNNSWALKANLYLDNYYVYISDEQYSSLKLARSKFEEVNIKASIKTLGSNVFKNKNGKYFIKLPQNYKGANEEVETEA